MKTQLADLALPELICLRRFFHGVDYIVSQDIDSSRVSYEEFLSSVLGRLLDGGSPFQAVLPYSLSQLNSDLAECGSGNRVTIEFETKDRLIIRLKTSL
jgi:hypothetical protein